MLNLLASIRKKNNTLKENGLPEVNIEKLEKDWINFLIENDDISEKI